MQNIKQDSPKSKRALSKIKKAKAAKLKADQLSAAKVKKEELRAAKLKAIEISKNQELAEQSSANTKANQAEGTKAETTKSVATNSEITKGNAVQPLAGKVELVDSQTTATNPTTVNPAADKLATATPATAKSKTGKGGKPKVRTAKHRVEKMNAARLNEDRVKVGKAPIEKPVKVGILHPRNPHRGRYDLDALLKTDSSLKRFIIDSPRGDTIDFSDAKAVLALNRALLAHYYKVADWYIPEGYLCPPIPGRADYIHYAADLLAGSGEIPKGRKVKVLDIGTGASCIYPIIGSQSYGWKFVASDVDSSSLKNAREIVESNVCLKNNVKLTHQGNRRAVFKGIVLEEEAFDLVMCNPPFHGSLAEVEAANKRKVMNLHTHKHKKGIKTKISDKQNFGGQARELWCQGGEVGFLKKMAKESKDYGHQVLWFTSLVSRSEHVWPLRKQLKQLRVKDIKVVKMSQGQKTSRFVAWTYFTEEERVLWADKWWDS